MSSRRVRQKGRKVSGGFVMVPFAILDSHNWKQLSGNATKLLFDLSRQYAGKNNGDLCATWSMMKQRGWRSSDTLNRARFELEHYGFILRTRQGGLNMPSLYALTWKPIDDCNGKISEPATNTAPGHWKEAKARFNPAKNRTPSRKSN